MSANDPPPAGRRTLLSVEVVRRDVRVAISAIRIAGVVEATLRAQKIRQAHVTVHFVSEREIARVHRAAMGDGAVTDIVTLQHRPAPGAPVVGEIYIAPTVARANARACGETVRAEIVRLVIHGVLHTLGWDHPTDARREQSPMWRRQEVLVQRFMQRGVA